MSQSYFAADTADDLMRIVIQAVMLDGMRVDPSKGPNRELAGVLLELSNPRARLSRTETRGKPFSCLGELCWYLAGANDAAFISYYVPAYEEHAEGEVIFGGYGPRLFRWRGADQVGNIVRLLKARPSSRRAVIQLFDALDLTENHKDVPCTCTLQFMIRDDTLRLITCMRSNDVFIGLPHDIFCFTMLQELVARTLSLEPGLYKHFVGSLHLYDKNHKRAQEFVNEGWQPTTFPMPPMPAPDPWTSVKALLRAEEQIRVNGSAEPALLASLDPYWADLVRLLLVLRYARDGLNDQIRGLQRDMSSNVYAPYIEARLTEQ